MNSKTACFVVVAVVLLIAGAIALLMPQTRSSSRAAVEVETLELTGVVRDFLSTHPDFGVVPSGGPGHYAGNVQRWLPGYRRPAFVPAAGFKVQQQWKDAEDRPIAPHLAGIRSGFDGTPGVGVQLTGPFELGDECTIDAFNSSYGPYGLNGNYGGRTVVMTNEAGKEVKIKKKAVVRGDVLVGDGTTSHGEMIDNDGAVTGIVARLDEPVEMPVISLPENLAPYVAHLDVNGSTTLTGDMDPDDEEEAPALHFGRLHCHHDSTLFVEGDLTIVCDDELKVDRTHVVLLPDAKLTVYVTAGNVELKDQTLINTEVGDTTAVSLNVLGTGKIKIEKDTHVYATIIAPQRKLELKKAHLYGAFVGEELKIHDKTAGLHVDSAAMAPGPWNFALTVRDKIEVKKNSRIDSFDSNLGPYGGTNAGSAAEVSTNSVKDHHVKLENHSSVGGNVLVGAGSDPREVVELKDSSVVTGVIGALAVPRAIPVVSPPAMGESLGDIEYDGGTHEITGEVRCKKLKLDHGAVLQVVGDTVIRCDDKVEVKDHSEIQLMPGATLTLYVKKDLKVEKYSSVNMNTGNPQLVSVRRTSVGSKGKVEIKDRSEVCRWIQGAKTELKLKDHSEFFGSFTGEKVKVEDHSELHVDMAYLGACVPIDDSAGDWGAAGDGGISSAATFNQWFRDMLGVNQSMPHTITLTRDGAGVYEYATTEFHPADDRLFGNEGAPHNHFLTYSIAGTFTYDGCVGQFIEFEGGDGAWLFVNDLLALDLGGLAPGVRQYVELDRLGLEEDREYEMRLFTAQRQMSDATFRLRTNIEWDTDGFVGAVSTQYD